VLGGSDWHGAEAIHARAAASPFAADIRFLGFVADAELPDLYRAAGAMVYPSLFEGFGLPPVEAMACGCPVISSTRGALGEVVSDAASIVEPEDPLSITAALTAMAQHDSLRSEFRERGLKNAARFNWEQTATQTIQVYRAAATQVAGSLAPKLHSQTS
jgi:glycosyltransferase involved in cell wall biosynthesis